MSFAPAGVERTLVRRLPGPLLIGVLAAFIAVGSLAGSAKPAAASTTTPATTTATVPGSINATGSTNVSAQLQNFINTVPDGSTVVFPTDAVYRIDSGLRLDSRHDLIFEGNGATLKASGCQGTDSAFVIGWDRSSSRITIHNFTLLGNNADGGTKAAYHAGCEFQMGVLIHQSNHIEISGVTIRNVYGDCVSVSDNDATLLWSTDVWFHDSTCKRNGRQGVLIAAGRRITVSNVAFKRIAMHVLDIEPSKVTGGGVDVVFRDSIVSTYGLSSRYRGWFVAINGTVQGADIHDLTVTGNRVTGSAMGMRIGVPGVKNVVFSGNISLVKAVGPVVRLDQVTNVTVTNNDQPMASGSFAKFTNCTNVTYTP